MSFTRRLALPALTLAVALAGCHKRGDTAASTASPSATTTTAARPHASAAPVAGVARKVEAETDAYDFGYGYPAKAASFPALKRQLDGEIDRMKAELASEAHQGQAEAKANGGSFHQYSSSKGWSVVTDLPDWLSLSAEVATYTGGAHGNMEFDTLLWDKRAGTRRAPVDLFTSKAAFRDAVAAPMCAALDRERAKRRGGDAYPAGDEFNKCIDPVGDATVILGSTDHRHFDRIGFLIAPYAAGPYVEGPYEVTVPVTPAMIAAVRPTYRSAFAPR